MADYMGFSPQNGGNSTFPEVNNVPKTWEYNRKIVAHVGIFTQTDDDYVGFCPFCHVDSGVYEPCFALIPKVRSLQNRQLGS